MSGDWVPDVARLQAREDAEWLQVERAFCGRLLAYAQRRTGDLQASEDIVQETLLGAVRGIDEFDPLFTFEQYMFGICRNRTIDHLRRKKARTLQAKEEDEGSFGIETLATESETPSAIVRGRELSERAKDLFGAILQADPENAAALAGMAQCMIAAGQHDNARQALASATEEMAKDPAIAAVLKQLDQIEEARKLGDPQALEQALAVNPDDHAARLKLAKIRNVEGDRQAAADHLLMIMKRDRAFEDDAARRELLQFFEVWGPKDPATIAARRKLSSILFS